MGLVTGAVVLEIAERGAVSDLVFLELGQAPRAVLDVGRRLVVELATRDVALEIDPVENLVAFRAGNLFKVDDKRKAVV